MNRAVALDDSEILVFTDANTVLNQAALKHLARHFADPHVALVAGAKRVIADDADVAAQEGLYWQYESWLKALESKHSSVIGAAGEIFAVRRSAYIPPPSHAIIEDFWLCMSLLRSGFRTVYEPNARATEYASPSMREELKRKTRIAAGGWQAVFAFADQLHPSQGRVAFQFLSHRVLRWVVVPVLLPVLFALNVLLAETGLYLGLLVIQSLFYVAAGLGWLLEGRRPLPSWLALPCFFVASHWACLHGGWRYLTGRQNPVWAKVQRDSKVPLAS
jgi:cellulose synthase/poly-beta-1,6-N-acetylglucosamine synthase-like glycosyltransferase